MTTAEELFNQIVRRLEASDSEDERTVVDEVIPNIATAEGVVAWLTEVWCGGEKLVLRVGGLDDVIRLELRGQGQLGFLRAVIANLAFYTAYSS